MTYIGQPASGKQQEAKMAVDGNELIKFSGQAWDSWVENIPLTIFYGKVNILCAI